MSTYGNFYLTQEQSDENALLVAGYLVTTMGWSNNAVAGVLGNMYRESGINPGMWQSLNEGNMSGGFGLVQWTPASNYIDWAISQGYETYDMYAQIVPQCHRICYEFDNGLQYYETADYPLSASEFKVSTQTPEYLAEVFLYNYERAGVEALGERKAWAKYYYSLITGETPAIPDDPAVTNRSKRKGYNFVLFNQRRFNRWNVMN